MVLGQGLERCADLLRQLAPHYGLARVLVGHVGQERAVARGVVFLHVFVELRDLALLAHVVDREVHDDSVQPRVKARGALEVRDVLVHLDERVLHHVHGVGRPLDDANGHRVRATVIFLEELLKRGSVALARSVDQRIVLMRITHLLHPIGRPRRLFIQGLGGLGGGAGRRFHGRICSMFRQLLDSVGSVENPMVPGRAAR